jgi:hypothetical protein
MVRVSDQDFAGNAFREKRNRKRVAYHAMILSKGVGFPCIHVYRVRKRIPYRSYQTLKDLNEALLTLRLPTIVKVGSEYDTIPLSELCNDTKTAIALPFDEDAIALPPSEVEKLNLQGTYTWYKPEHLENLIAHFRNRPHSGNAWKFDQDRRVIAKKFVEHPVGHIRGWYIQLNDKWNKTMDSQSFETVKTYDLNGIFYSYTDEYNYTDIVQYNEQGQTSASRDM